MPTTAAATEDGDGPPGLRSVFVAISRVQAITPVHAMDANEKNCSSTAWHSHAAPSRGMKKYGQNELPSSASARPKTSWNANDFRSSGLLRKTVMMTSEPRVEKNAPATMISATVVSCAVVSAELSPIAPIVSPPSTPSVRESSDGFGVNIEAGEDPKKPDPTRGAPRVPSHFRRAGRVASSGFGADPSRVRVSAPCRVWRPRARARSSRS